MLNILYTIKHVQLYYEHELLVLIADTVVYCILLKTTLQQSTCNVQYSNKRKDTTLMEHFQNPIEISSRGKIDTHNTQILNSSLSVLCTGIVIKSVRVKLVAWALHHVHAKSKEKRDNFFGASKPKAIGRITKIC